MGLRPEVHGRYTVPAGGGLDFDWVEANSRHIARHEVTMEEAEQAVRNDPVDLGSETVDGEERLLNLGRTDGGRVLLVVTTMRENRVRVVTAYPAGRRLVAVYFEQKGG
jgi:hypothetical protein